MDFVFGKIETIKGQLNEVRRLEERVTKMEETKERYLVLAGNLDVLARDTDREPDKLLSDLDTVLRSIREAVAKQNERDKVLKLVEERTNRKRVAERTLADAQKAFENAVRRESEAWNNWRRWVSDRGFGAEISPPIALEALTKMGECVRTIQEREEIRSNCRTADARA
jgi:exonuclease III